MEDDYLFCTEAEVKKILIDVVGRTDEAPAVFVAYREQDRNKFLRKVTFVIQTEEGNEELINNIVKESLKYDTQFKFTKSDINVQSGNLTMDYLFVEANIYPKL